jgi:small neutral amino acid transporter SnatA (MarC family)
MRVQKENVCACVGKAVIITYKHICAESIIKRLLEKSGIYVLENVFGVFIKRKERTQTK